MILEKLKQAAMQQGMKLMSNPKLMKVMADPRVMKVMMQAMQLPGRVKSEMDARAGAVAKSLGLATKAEIATLKDSIRSLESSLHDMEKKLDGKSGGKSKGAAAGA